MGASCSFSKLYSQITNSNRGQTPILGKFSTHFNLLRTPYTPFDLPISLKCFSFLPHENSKNCRHEILRLLDVRKLEHCLRMGYEVLLVHPFWLFSILMPNFFVQSCFCYGDLLIDNHFKFFPLNNQIVDLTWLLVKRKFNETHKFHYQQPTINVEKRFSVFNSSFG